MPIIEAKSNVNVVTGILKKQKFFLITTRPKGKSFADFWEFPGGKVAVPYTHLTLPTTYHV